MGIKDIYYMIKNYPNLKKILSSLWTGIKKIFSSLRPKEHKVNLLIGFEDPSKTGDLLGKMWPVISLLNLNVLVDGDFDREILNGKVFFSGKFSLMNIVVPLLKVLILVLMSERIRRKWTIKDFFSNIKNKVVGNKNKKIGLV